MIATSSTRCAPTWPTWTTARSTVYPGNYDDYMVASTQAREQQLSANAKAKERVAELQEFVRRFSANKSKARQATSRARQIDKIKIEDIKPSSRQYPFIRFDYDEREKLHRLAVEVKSWPRAYDQAPCSRTSTSASTPASESPSSARTASAKPRCCAVWPVRSWAADAGFSVKWAEKAKLGYFAQDHAADFAGDRTLTDWIGQWTRTRRRRRADRCAAPLGACCFPATT